MDTELERLGKVYVLTTFIRDFFQRTKHLFSEKMRFGFLLIPPPIFIIFCLRCRWGEQKVWRFSKKISLHKKMMIFLARVGHSNNHHLGPSADRACISELPEDLLISHHHVLILLRSFYIRGQKLCNLMGES